MTSELDQLADRHLRPDPQSTLAAPEAAIAGRVLVGIESRLAQTKAGQDMLWMLSNLLCRQFKLVTGISYDVPEDVPLQSRVAGFGAARTLKDTVFNCVRLVAGKHVAVTDQRETTEQHFIEIFIGRPEAAPRAPVRLVLYADGWRLFVGHSFSQSDLPRSDVTFGPYMAACFAAGEVFKRLRGMKPGKGSFIGEDHELCVSLWTANPAASWM